ncbi:MAG: BsaWI family type II restriction enzyme [Pyrobaculum sp.]
MKEQLQIRNWSDILPDVDIAIVDKLSRNVKVVISCKTSLRERLTETAFWKLLTQSREKIDVKFILITTNKDKELEIDTNRYIIQHVLDCTFITDPEKYKDLINTYKIKYGEKEDFGIIYSKVKPIAELREFLRDLLKPQ